MNPFLLLKRTLRLFVVLFFYSTFAFANDSSYIRFKFHPGLDSNRLTIVVHDGIQEHSLKLKETNTWKGELFSPYGHISVFYSRQDTAGHSKRIFFGKGNTIVTLMPNHTTKEPFVIDEKASRNIVSYEKMGGAELDEYVKEKSDSQFAFYYRNKNRFGADESLIQKIRSLDDTVQFKRMEFMRQWPGFYASYWTFITHVSRTEAFSPDTLLATFNKIFPAKYKSTKAAKFMAAMLNNKIAIATKSHFPEFSVTDINNNIITSETLRGKYVLIQFWASWCRPCVEELPALRVINEKYQQSPFSMLSISIDQNKEAFQHAVVKHSMNWTQVYGDLRLYYAMGYAPIPQIYLLDKSGRTIYNNLKGTDPNLQLLQKLLSEKLANR